MIDVFPAFLSYIPAGNYQLDVASLFLCASTALITFIILLLIVIMSLAWNFTNKETSQIPKI